MEAQSELFSPAEMDLHSKLASLAVTEAMEKEHAVVVLDEQRWYVTHFFMIRIDTDPAIPPTWQRTEEQIQAAFGRARSAAAPITWGGAGWAGIDRDRYPIVREYFIDEKVGYVREAFIQLFPGDCAWVGGVNEPLSAYRDGQLLGVVMPMAPSAFTEMGQAAAGAILYPDPYEALIDALVDIGYDQGTVRAVLAPRLLHDTASMERANAPEALMP